MDIATATKSDFEPFVDKDFTVDVEEGHSESITLIEVKTYSEEMSKGYPREPFSLLFRGPVGRTYPQQMYDFHHNELGDFSLFLVPIREDTDGVIYESIIS